MTPKNAQVNLGLWETGHPVLISTSQDHTVFAPLDSHAVSGHTMVLVPTGVGKTAYPALNDVVAAPQASKHDPR